ncbi:ATP-grasp ribosomal peptide maturase [Salinispora pacifica]|uniref:ATP-grasp ribosomal peptide maturase n=1 Tax=Salinispora pacifica TaxID=351187 RepID=UPI00048596C7|nr:ATP-grasp ribosomal peptide maturase [Salinispora pacifica]
MGGQTVVVFTAEFDVTADAVIVELERRGTPVFRCDPGAFPSTVVLGAQFGESWTGRLRADRRVVDVADVACAWWRRPTRIEVSAEVPHSGWVRAEAVAGLRGILAVLPWLNNPDDIRAAEHKPLQLATAAQVGMSVPATLVTNDPGEARAFAETHGPIIYKSMTTGILDGDQVIYACPVDPATLDGGVAVTAHMFQQKITKAYELRVSVVDGNLFTARIDALTNKGRADWRADYRNLRYSVETLPDDVAAKVRRFLKLRRLRFAALDFIVTPEGEHVFLEANPNGQWAWIEDQTGLPIAAAIADALEGVTHD